MPGRRFGRPRFLHQDMIVEQLHAGRTHQIRGDFGDRRSKDHVLELFDPLPITVVVEEPARLAFL